MRYYLTGFEVFFVTGNEALYDRFWGIIGPVLRHYMTVFEVLYDQFRGIFIWPVLRYYMTNFEVFLYDRFWGIIWPSLWGSFDVKFDVTVFCHSSPLLSNFSMLPFCWPRFFSLMFSYSTPPSSPPPPFTFMFHGNRGLVIWKTIFPNLTTHFRFQFVYLLFMPDWKKMFPYYNFLTAAMLS